MKFVMTMAWQIATDAAEKFGGKKSEYISEAMKMAWDWYKNDDTDMISLFKDIRDVMPNDNVKLWQNYGKHRIYINHPRGSKSYIEFASERGQVTHYELSTEMDAEDVELFTESIEDYNFTVKLQKRVA